MSKSIYTLCIVSALVLFSGVNATNDLEGENELATAFLNFTQYCEYYNYPVETHYVTTEDGYILTYFRLQAKGTTIQPNLPVIFLHHGLLDSSDTFIINYEAGAPAFMAANRGYDVWVGNSRGNKYCMSHVSLSSSNPAFWAFSWQEMSEYDLPAGLEYIYENTNQMINYIGHSQGTSIMFAALARQDPTIPRYVRTFCALGPVTFVNHETSNLLALVAHTQLASILTEFGVVDFMGPNWASTHFGAAFCTVLDFACKNILGIIADADPEYDSYERMNIILGHFPGGTSTQDLMYFRQMVLTAQNESIFAYYDYGATEDQAVYGQPTAPVYDLGKVDFPVHMFVGQDDRLADPQDAMDTKNALTGAPIVTFNLYPDMGHASFIWGKNMTFMNDVFNVIETNTWVA